MNSLATLLLLAVLIGCGVCMSVVEQDPEEKNELGWWLHIHIGEKAENRQKTLGCTGNPCYLCKKSKFDASLHGNTVSTAYEYDGCVIISKTPDDKYRVGVTINDELQYENAYEMRGNENLPCIYPDESKPEGRICPHIYNVDLENGKMCASLDEYLQITDTRMRHDNALGCAEGVWKSNMFPLVYGKVNTQINLSQIKMHLSRNSKLKKKYCYDKIYLDLL